MFALFFSLYYSMFVGSWTNFNWQLVMEVVEKPLNGLGYMLTSIFGENFETNFYEYFGNYTVYGVGYSGVISMLAFVLACITSIGIVVVATKGVKKAFGIFFMGIR